MAPNTSRHLDSEDIESYSSETAAEEDATRIEEHLLICETCRARVLESDRRVHAMQSAAAEIRKQQSGAAARSRNRGRAVIFLAAAAVILGVFAIVWNRDRSRPAVAVTLTAMRGGDALAHAPSGTPLRLDPDTNGLPPSQSYKLDMVDAVGRKVWQGAFPGAPAAPQPKGTYFIRISIGDGEPLREYRLQLQ